MKTLKNLLFISMSVMLLTFSACNSTDSKSTTQDQDTTKTKSMANVQYTCPMHPDVISDKPGKCPKCGMDLVVKETKKNMGGMKMDSAEMKKMKK